MNKYITVNLQKGVNFERKLTASNVADSEVDALLRVKRRKETKAKYYQKNKERLNEKSRRYHKDHREESNKKSLQYHKAHKEALNKKCRQYYQEHKKELVEYRRQYRANNPELIKQYRDENRAIINKKHSTIYRSRIRKYQNNRLKNDLNFRLTLNLRTNLRKAIKGNFKSGSAVADLGCTIPELRQHIEKQFKIGMNWDNWGQFGWHIDHIIPLDSFDLSNRTQLLKAVNYTNLQPLWWRDNLIKANKI